MSARGSHDGDYRADSVMTGKVWDTEAVSDPKNDLNSAFRHVGVDPDQVAAFAYRLNLISVDLLSQFGWRGRPRWWVW